MKGNRSEAVRRSAGARLADRAVQLSQTRVYATALDVLDRVFEAHRGERLAFEDRHGVGTWYLHPRFGGPFPDLLATAFSRSRTREFWRSELAAAEADSDLSRENALMAQWERMVTRRFQRRYALQFELW